MKIMNKIKYIISIFIISILSISSLPSYASVPSQIDQYPPRDEVVWATDSIYAPYNLNPWSPYLAPFSQLMFETLFGYNSYNQSYIPVIGETFSWMNGGSELHISLNTHAEWSNGNPITANDVVKSYELASYQPQWKTDLPLRFKNFTEANSTGVIFYMNSDYNFSRRAIDWISTNIPIIPWIGVYQEIYGIYADGSGSLSSFENNWWDPSFNPAWKVCSGPYAPIYRNNEQTESIYQRRDDWWGNSTNVQLYSDIPNWNKGGHPKYIGNRIIMSQSEADDAFRSGWVDLHGGYYQNMQNDFGSNNFLDYSGSWYNQTAPYQIALSRPINVAFNHESALYPELGEPWFREAMAWMIDYDAIPLVAESGYWRKSEATILDNLSTVHKPYFNESLANQYRRTFNTTHAEAILKLHDCWKQPNGMWNFGAAYGNRSIGPYTMICPNTWTDVRIFTEMICEDFTNFGIPVNFEGIPIEMSGGWEIWRNRWKNRDYDLGMSNGKPYVIESPEEFLKAWRDEIDWNTNITGWHSNKAMEFNELYLQLEIEPDSDRYQYLLDEIQRILCEEIPEIPCFISGYSYAYSEFFWEGFTSIDNEYQQPITTWDNSQIPIKTRMILNLVSTGRILDATPPIWDVIPSNRLVSFGQPFYYDVDATDDFGYVFYSINDTSNFRIDSSTGEIENNTILLPSTTYYLNITAFDAFYNYVSTTISIDVITDTTDPTWIIEPTDQKVNYGQPFFYDVNATDNTDYVSYAINDNFNFTINPITGLITNNTVLNVGFYSLTISAIDYQGNSIEKSINIQVLAPDAIPGYDLMILIIGIFISIMSIGIYRWKKLIYKK
ncbi:MAG: hypothetical protein JXA99_03695 [Candidatus Lokiarchaeota archaeon]|nr:hypothetical protein [Candidatus Lokiarchaeota archaeon]